jgi:hypothetical protein
VTWTRAPSDTLLGDTGLHVIGALMSTYLTRLRKRAFLSQNTLCYYCEQVMWLPGFNAGLGHSPSHLQCTAEHLVPVSEGGKTSRNNIVAACLFCNQTRHRTGCVLSPQQYKELVQRYVQGEGWHGPSQKDLSVPRIYGWHPSPNNRMQRSGSP